jgi:hypothetical protein
MNIKSFIEGVKHLTFIPLLDPEVQEILNRTNEEAIKSDWEQVGQDINNAILKYKETLSLQSVK